MWLLGYPGWLLRCCYAVARVFGWLLRCCYAVTKGKGSGVWPSMVTHTRNLSSAFNPSKCPKVPGWLLGCCYAVARVTGVVAKVLLCSC